MGRRAVIVWLVIIVAETVNGVLRQLFLAPGIGDLPARQIGVAIGSVLILAIAMIFSRWLGARTLRDHLAIGFLWVALTLAFEIALGRALGLSRDRMLADYDLGQGGFMALGLLFMLLAPALAAAARAAWSRRAT